MKKCLIVVDYQNDFVSGALGFHEAAALEEAIAEKIRQYRKHGDEADYLDTQEGRNLPVAHCLRGTPGHALYGQVAALIQEADRQFHKVTFGSDELYEHLKLTPFASIELAGVVSNICVISNAVLAKTAQPETPILVDARCTASNDANLHEAVLRVMAGLQVRILNG